MHFGAFDGAPICWNPSFFPIVIIDSVVSLKLFVNFKLIWFSLCSTKILLDVDSGGMIYLDRLMVGTFPEMFISLTFLEILWIIKSE